MKIQKKGLNWAPPLGTLNPIVQRLCALHLHAGTLDKRSSFLLGHNLLEI